jgi:hypothetical protein
MDRRRRYGEAIDAAEREDLGALLGRTPASVEEGRARFVSALEARRLEDDAVIRTLARKAYRDEWLHAPAADLYPKRVWSRLD